MTPSLPMLLSGRGLVTTSSRLLNSHLLTLVYVVNIMFYYVLVLSLILGSN
jgi:hypothetical protein